MTVTVAAVAELDKSGTKSYYQTLQEAFTASTGDTIKVIADI